MSTGAKQLEEKVESILDNYQRDKGMLVSVLQDIQAEYNYLSKETLGKSAKP